MRPALSVLAILLHRLARHEPAATIAVLPTARPGGDGHGRADDPIVAYDTLDSVVVGIDQRRTMATKVRRADEATYRSAGGELVDDRVRPGRQVDEPRSSFLVVSVGPTSGDG